MEWGICENDGIKLMDHIQTHAKGVVIDFVQNAVCLFGISLGHQIHHMSLQFFIVAGYEHTEADK